MDTSKITLDGMSINQRQLTALMEIQIPETVEVDNPHDYEENMEWDEIRFYFHKHIITFPEGYTGLWELTHYNKFNAECKRDVIDQLMDWVEWQYNNQD